jgi:2-oxoglutarate ferredoxin oxidoreductase subunit alpha
MATGISERSAEKPVKHVQGVTIRLVGDSGDGMQLVGAQLTNTSALAGNDIATFPDFPAEIRAPRGTRAGVSGFQLQFAAHEVHTPGDSLDALVAMNPAALVTNLKDLRTGGLLIVNEDNFEEKDLKLAKLSTNPLDEPSMENYRLVKVGMTKLTRSAVAELGLGPKDAERCKNFFALGLVYWLYGRDLESTLRFISGKFAKAAPEVGKANESALRAGWAYGETIEAFGNSYQVDAAELPPGHYRNIMGNQAIALGLVAAASRSKKEIFYASYPITPASDILHEMVKFKNFGVCTFQAEDEIAAACAAIGAAYGGVMAVTTSSGPGIALKGEAMGLAMMLELPMVIINVQRGGPSTGLPTKTEQSDLLQAMFGRNGEAPMPVFAARSPADCFDIIQDAWKVALKLMVPVIVLSDGYIANGSEPWLIPDVSKLPPFDVTHPSGPPSDGSTFLPYERDELLSRPWAIPGTPGLMHRVGGIEKENGSGNISYDPDNHQKMVEIRAQKVANAAKLLPDQEVVGPQNGELLVVSWGGTYGSCLTAVRRAQEDGLSVAHAHVRCLNPLPANMGDILSRYDKVLIPELNAGQLRMLIRSQFLVDAIGLNKIKGLPFMVSEVYERICELCAPAVAGSR